MAFSYYCIKDIWICAQFTTSLPTSADVFKFKYWWGRSIGFTFLIEFYWILIFFKIIKGRYRKKSEYHLTRPKLLNQCQIIKNWNMGWAIVKSSHYSWCTRVLRLYLRGTVKQFYDWAEFYDLTTKQYTFCCKADVSSELQNDFCVRTYIH